MVENVAIQPPTLGDAYAAAALHYQSWVATYTRLLAPDQAARLTLEERAGHWERLLRERPGQGRAGRQAGQHARRAG